MVKLTYREAPSDEVVLHWHLADPLTIQATRALYLFRKERGREILYIGKADRQTLHSRWSCRSKGRLAKLERKEKIRLRPLITGFHTKRRVTPQLIDDVERLLIFLVQPRWNHPGKETCRLHHRDLFVRCDGDWPHRRTPFWYSDDFPNLLSYGSE